MFKTKKAYDAQKNKDIIKTEIDKYNNLLVNDNKIGNDRKELMYKINNDYLVIQGHISEINKHEVYINQLLTTIKEQKIID